MRTPLAVDPLTLYEGKAAQDEILAYQKRIGSIMFAATGTRPDIAKTASFLSQFLTNPGPEHLSTANRAISYLVSTKGLEIQYSGNISQEEALYSDLPFHCYSDAA